MRLINREQSQLLDKLATTVYKISMEQLIHQASLALFKKFENLFAVKKNQITYNDKIFNGILFLIGPGNNGNDGLGLAKLIREKYPQVSIRIMNLQDLSQISDIEIPEPIILVDALFGVGLDRPLSKEIIQAIKYINSHKELFKIIAVDIPTGLDSDTGNDFGAILQADFTFACEFPKLGCFLNQGPYYSGKIVSVKVGFPKKLINELVNGYRLIQRQEAQKIYPHRSFKGNKSNYGHLLVIAGSDKMPGALRLASEAASRAGVGYITIVVDQVWLTNAKNIKSLFPDFILSSKEELLKTQGKNIVKKYSAILYGPGLDDGKNNLKLLKKILKLKIKTLIDAEGINLIAKHSLETHGDCLLTPHAGELSKLISKSAKEIENDREAACKEFCQNHEGILLLKGFKTIIFGQNKLYVIASGNKALSKAGTGDVLSGIVGAFLAQGLSLEKAACLGAYIHGALADRWVLKNKNPNALMASDLVRGLKKSIIIGK